MKLAVKQSDDLIRRGDVDPRNLCYPIKMYGTEYSDYERGYNDGIIACYYLIWGAKAMDAECAVRENGRDSAVRAHWIYEAGECWHSENGNCVTIVDVLLVISDSRGVPCIDAGLIFAPLAEPRCKVRWMSEL